MLSQLQLFIFPFLAGSISIIAGAIMLKFPPKEINMLYGYKTKRSMSNQKNWDFSQKFSALKMTQVGVILIVVSFVISAFKVPEKAHSAVIIAGVVTSITALLSTIIITEQKLKQRE